jgi:hypothetical protein
MTEIGTTHARANGRRFVRYLLLALCFAVTPFATLVTIDMVGLWTSENKLQYDRRHQAIYATLVDQAERGEQWSNTADEPMYVITQRVPCNRLVVSEVERIERTSDSSLSAEEIVKFLNWRIPVTESEFHNWGLGPKIRHAEAAQTITPLAASALRACIAATPFSGWCIQRYSERVRNSDLKFEEKLLHMELIRKIEGATKGWRQYCSIVPEIQLDGAKRL